jgi:signal transduction histidine kinase
VSLFLFSPDSIVAQMILTMSVMIGAAAITVSTIVYRPVFYTTILLIAPLLVQFVRVGDEVHYIFALACVGFSAILFYMNSSVNQVVEQSIRLRFSNYKLASDLRVQKEIAEKSSMAKSSFLAVASHDLRQPLHAHGLFLGELRERLPEDEDTVVGRIINNLDSSIRVISELFDSLLDISRLEAGVVETNIQSFFIDEVIRPIVEQYRIKANASGVALRAVLPHRVISTDKILLGRILHNLLENAVRNTTQGKILVGCRRRNNSLMMQVWDTGCGIKEDELDNIFKDYYQVRHKNNQRTRGLGLGLAVVSRLCDLLGHAISVRSVFGKGSVFSIEVPMSESVDISSHDTSQDANFVIDGLAGMKVLVIDDDETVRRSMSGILDSWKCSVITGSDAENVISKLPSGYIPDAIIADYQLNDGKTGPREIEVLNARFNRDVDAAVITGDTTFIDNELKECRYQLLQKPVSPAKLCTLLRYLRSKR